MFSTRTRLTAIVAFVALAVGALALINGANAAANWSIRISASGPTDHTDASGTTWLSDRYYQGGTGSGPILGSINKTSDDVLYGRHRWGMQGYRIPVPAAATYRVSLHFAEVVFSQSGKRVFDVTAEGAMELKALDVAAEVGYATPLVETFDVPVSDGTLDLGFKAIVEDPMISAIEVEQVSTAKSTDAGAGFDARIRLGSKKSFTDSSGSVWTTGGSSSGGRNFGPVNLPVSGTSDDGLYQSHRWGMTGYRVKVPAAGTYDVSLMFAEMVFTSPGKRVFDVSEEGVVVANDLDVVAQVGPRKALVKTNRVNVTDGTLNIKFSAEVEDPMLSGIRVTKVGAGTSAPTTSSTTATTAPPTTTAPPATTTPPTTAPPTTTTTSPKVTASTGYPDASNTGVPGGTTLTSTSGFSTSRDGQVIDAMDVNGPIQVNHNNVTIRRTRIHNPRGVAILQDPSKSGLVIEDSELDGSGNTDGVAAVGFANYTIRRSNIHHFGEGLTASGNNVIEDNYLHDFGNYIAQGAHQDGIQIEWGDNVTVRHNTVLMNVDGANSAIWVSAGNPHKNVLIDNNLVAGASFSVGLGNQATATNNRVSTRYYPNGGYYGAFTYTSGALMSGNVWYESGKAI